MAMDVVMIPTERLEWEIDAIASNFGAGNVEAIKAGVGPLRIKAVYQGRTSNVVEVSWDRTRRISPER